MGHPHVNLVDHDWAADTVTLPTCQPLERPKMGKYKIIQTYTRWPADQPTRPASKIVSDDFTEMPPKGPVEDGGSGAPAAPSGPGERLNS